MTTHPSCLAFWCLPYKSWVNLVKPNVHCKARQKTIVLSYSPITALNNTRLNTVPLIDRTLPNLKTLSPNTRRVSFDNNLDGRGPAIIVTPDLKPNITTLSKTLGAVQTGNPGPEDFALFRERRLVLRRIAGERYEEAPSGDSAPTPVGNVKKMRFLPFFGAAEERVCAGCGAPGAEKKLMVCTRCNSVYYCGKECQGADWKKHKGSCKKTAGSAERSKTDGGPPEGLSNRTSIIYPPC